ncbi:MAG: GNAT family N-acetyltransferase [Asgard group archaeon]|nr:GNAT family N-acetyltransferase [Asgard group archaeon]
MTIVIQKLERKNEDALIDICFITGDKFLKKTFPNPYLFSLFWCLYYVRYETNNCFVVFDLKTKKVVGYILSTLNTEIQEEDFKEKMAPIIKQKMKELHIRSLRSRLVALFVMNKPKTKKRKRFLNEYPGHLHIDILPDYQRQGFGHRLMNTLESHFKEKCVTGYHLEVSSNNKLGISFYRKYGLELISKNRFSLIFGKKLTK